MQLGYVYGTMVAGVPDCLVPMLTGGIGPISRNIYMALPFSQSVF